MLLPLNKKIVRLVQKIESVYSLLKAMNEIWVNIIQTKTIFAYSKQKSNKINEKIDQMDCMNLFDKNELVNIIITCMLVISVCENFIYVW